MGWSAILPMLFKRSNNDTAIDDLALVSGGGLWFFSLVLYISSCNAPAQEKALAWA